MGDVAVALLVGLPTAVVFFGGGFLVGRRFRLPAPIEEALERVGRHEHAWHIDGKVSGRVMVRCISCQRKRQRD